MNNIVTKKNSLFNGNNDCQFNEVIGGFMSAHGSTRAAFS